MAKLAMDDMTIYASDSKLNVDIHQENIMSFNAQEKPNVYIRTEVKDGKAYIYLKNDIAINAYTLTTNSKIEYKFMSQKEGGDILKIARWTNIHNPDTGKIAGFTAVDVIQHNDYDLFIVLDNVDEKFEFVDTQVFKSAGGKTLAYRIID